MKDNYINDLQRTFVGKKTFGNGGSKAFEVFDNDELQATYPLYNSEKASFVLAANSNEQEIALEKPIANLGRKISVNAQPRYDFHNFTEEKDNDNYSGTTTEGSNYGGNINPRFKGVSAKNNRIDKGQNVGPVISDGGKRNKRNNANENIRNTIKQNKHGIDPSLTTSKRDEGKREFYIIR